MRYLSLRWITTFSKRSLQFPLLCHKWLLFELEQKIYLLLQNTSSSAIVCSSGKVEGANWKLFFNQGDCRDTRFLVKFKFPRCCHSAQATESYFEFAWLANLVAIICFLFGFAEIGSWLVRRWATPPPRPHKMAEKELSAILQLESIATCWVWRCTTHATLPFGDAPFFEADERYCFHERKSLSFLWHQVHISKSVSYLPWQICKWIRVRSFLWWPQHSCSFD